MKIIKNYWGNKEQEIKSENDFKDYIKNNEVKKCFIGLKEIKNFKLSIKNDRMHLTYALRKNVNHRYYANFLNHAIALNNNCVVFLEDVNYENYENRILTKETIMLLNS